MTKIAAGLTMALGLFLLNSASAGPVIREENGTRYEFLGLEHRSVQELQDTLAVLAPGVPLGRCAAYLTQVLGFPEASVILHQDSIGNYWVATVIEPENKGRLVYTELPDHVADTIHAWAPAFGLADTDNMNFQAAIYSRVAQLKGRAEEASGTPVPDWADTITVRALWSALDSLTADEYLESAIHVFESDANRANRLGALAVLANFPEDDRAWYTVMKAMTVRDQVVSGMASALMYAFAEQFPRRIDWSPVVAEVRAILDGVNLFNLQTTLRCLKASSLDRDLAKRIHVGRFRVLGLWLNAEHEPTRSLAADYLREVSGQDFDTDAAKWEKWAAE